MTDDLTTIRQRWSDAGPWHYAESVEDFVPIAEIRDIDGNPLLYLLGLDETGRAVLQLAAHAPADIRTLIGLIESERARQAELYKLIDNAQTAQQAWTEIGAKAEATAVGLAGTLGEAADVLLSRAVPNAFDRELAAKLRERARAEYPFPLLSAAQRLVAAWDRLCDCTDEFADYNLEAEACGELKQYLDDAIVALKELVESGQQPSRPAESVQGVPWTLSVAMFRACLLDIANPRALTLFELRRLLYLARKQQPEQDLEPHEIAAYINSVIGERAANAPEVTSAGLVTDQSSHETLAEGGETDGKSN